ncbi:MAG: hypothetical protein SFZ03_00335 [Candidatus Melainabacteria bacterium]|nr:hypothetical protein [Candidatus Melainabacteria bacterium]
MVLAWKPTPTVPAPAQNTVGYSVPVASRPPGGNPSPGFAIQPNPNQRGDSFGKLLSVPFEPDTLALAERFANATWRMPGIEVEDVQKIFSQVNQTRRWALFNQAAVQKAWMDGRPFHNVVEVVSQELAGNSLSRFFNRAPLLSCMDAWLYGQDTYRAKPSDYRLRGMWTSIADFLSVCKQHPVMSSVVIGSVGYFGAKYPFLGGASGALILAWSATASLLNEYRARHVVGMTPQKAEYYRQSGENLMAFLLTLSGVDGIYKGVVNGLKAFRAVPAARSSAFAMDQLPLRLWSATKAKLKHGEETGIRFVLGLFDNVLLPFNALAEKLNIGSDTP